MAFWEQIARGLLAEEAAAVIGVAQAVGARWFHNAGGMAPFDIKQQPLGRYLSFAEREEIALLKVQGKGVREIARTIGRDAATVSRELRRNAATRSGKREYRASVAQWKADMAARRPKVAKLVANPQLHVYVQQRLAGQVTLPDGTVVEGPTPPRFTGRNKPHRKDRPWTLAWSPEQIANRIKLDFPDDESMRISHEAIYQSLYIEGRGALKRELVWCLRTGRALRVPRERSRRKTWAHVTPETLISERPANAEDRVVPGHWEGDLVIGLERSAVGTVVERKTKYTVLVHLPREIGYRHKETPKNGPALAGYGATMKNALANAMADLPTELARSLTWDRGKEMSAHAQFKVETGIPVFFADPNSPWQRGTNENTNGLLRQYFPKGTDLSRWSAGEIQAIAHTLNTRPRKILGWKTPAEAFNEHLLCSNKPVLHPPVEPGQFRSRKFVHALNRHQMVGSMGRVGAAGDNAAMESFFSLLQKNMLDRRVWETREELRIAIVTWIERTYHRRRRQAALGRLTPVEYELIMAPPVIQAA